ncbi:MAG: biotin/lipoyl-binding protein [Thermoanaerobaculia bacterium]
MAGGPEKLLRKAALERLSSPEQLDMAMRATSPMGWVALTAIGVALMAGVLWGIFGSITERVDGQGVLIRGESRQGVASLQSGRVEQILVQPGDPVAAGQVVARLRIDQLETEIRKAEGDIADLEASVGGASGTSDSLIATHRGTLAALRAQRSRTAELVRKGYRTTKDLLQIDQQIAAEETAIVQAQQGQSDRSLQLASRKGELTKLEAQRDAFAQLRAPIAGKVTEVRFSVGAVVQAGTVVISLEDMSKPLQALVLIPETEAKRVANDMEVRIQPLHIKPDEYGFMLGKVTFVSEQRISPDELDRILLDQAQVQQLSKLSPFKAYAALIPDDNPKNKTGFKWTSAVGPPSRVTGGTPCLFQVIVDQKRPISYVIPLVKKTLGG